MNSKSYMFDIDAVVIGAGAVGLACGARIAGLGLEVLVLEAADIIGSGTSSRNSEVVHAGLYYPTGSLKHLTCVAGRRALYPFLDSHGVAYKKCSKLIVACSNEQDAQISGLLKRGLENDVEGLEPISGRTAMTLESNLRCTSALWSHETGIFDSHGYMVALQGELEDHGGVVVFNTPVTKITARSHGGFDVHTGGAEPTCISCRILVNSAGLFAQEVAACIDALDEAHIPAQYLAKGSYFQCAGKGAFSRLIYPAPVDGGLGVHVTLDLQGQMRFGPDVEWLNHSAPKDVVYKVDIRRADSFYAAVRTYWPDLPDGAILPDYAGCRPKLTPPGAPAGDFMIQTSQTHRLAGLVNLFGIESPGLTASLDIASRVSSALQSDLN
jgi:L-2-hydroxyglutarate oxidase LhgO